MVTKKKVQKPETRRNREVEVEEDGALRPAIYRALLASCEAEVPYLGVWRVMFRFEVRGPVGACGELELVVSTEEEREIDYLCRVFAVAGLVVERPSDLPLACREAVGRQFYVELRPDGELHVLQLATTHRVAAPEGAAPRFPKAYDFPCGEDDDDPSDPWVPRFHGCDLAQKAELRLHPFEVARLARAAAEA